MKTNDGATRVLIFSSNSFVRVGLRQTFEAHSGTTITGEATSSMAARELLEQGRPDLVVLDVSSDMKLTDILGRLRQSVPRARIVLLVVSADMDLGRQGLDLGADVIMMKSQPASILLAIIDSMAKHAPHHNRSISHGPKQGSSANSSTGRAASSSSSSADSLTDREREVVVLVSKGLSNRDIADKLCITETTVPHHLTSIFDKLGVSNRQKPLLLALERGLNEVSASA